MKSLKLTFVAIIFSMSFMGYSFGQKGITNMTDTIPVDPNVIIGKLDNGLTYYIRKNSKPENRVELRLAVNAGSINENKSQLGLAHFVEHMCFNGTKTFDGNKMIDYLQKYGISFGGDLNAYTSFDETVYMLKVPTDNKNLLDTALQIIVDWSNYVTFNSKEIDKERGIITEEWRLGLGADDRLMKKYFPVAFKNSMYADRLPIGEIDVIKNFPYDTLRAFYKSWYRPNLQAVAIVGDIDVKEMEKEIKLRFSPIQNPLSERPRLDYEVPNNKEPLISIATDKEASGTMLLLVYKHKTKDIYTVADYKTLLTATLYNEMLNARFNEITQKPDAPFAMAASSYGSFVRSIDAYQLYASPKENQIDKSFEQLLLENLRVKKYGFTETELERIKEQMLSELEKAAKESDKTESARLIDEYVSHFLEKDAIPGAKIEYKLAQKLLPLISLNDVNALATEWITDENMVIIVTAPEKEGVLVPTEKQMLDIIASSKNKELAPYVDKFKAEPLVNEADLAGTKVVSKIENKELEYTELTFANGVQVVVKNTKFKNDEILVNAYSLGGLSLYNENEYPSAFFASNILSSSGVGNFDQTELEKKLKGKEVNISPFIDDLREGFTGNCSPKDFETLLQLSYLYCKAPRKDQVAYEAYMSNLKNQIKFLGASPIYVFYDTLFKTATSNNARTIVIPNERILNKIDFEKAFTVFSERFGNANDFKFFIVGNIDVDSITPLLEKYLGSLPVQNKKENWKDSQVKFPEGVTDLEFQKGTDPQSMVGIVLNEKFEWTDKNRICLKVAKEILDIQLVELIREELSGVYSPQVQLSYEQFPNAEFSIMIMFGCSPKNTKKLTKAVFGIFKGMYATVEQKNIDKAKETLIREREVDLKTNKFWVNNLMSYYFNSDNSKLTTDYENMLNEITANDIKEFAKKYFKQNHYVRVVLKPEVKK
ncbi:MAG TPA: insulinase family protein [Bacteroidales bacterium]|nr:insulinase family protein [Bacteroidales bacterium]